MLDSIRSGRAMPRGLMLALLASALLLRILVPAGWMPASDGRFAIVPCSGSGELGAPEPSPAAHAGHHGYGTHDAHASHASHAGQDKPGHHQHQQGQADHPCTFAGLGFAFAEPVLPAPPPPPALLMAARPLPALAVSVGRGLAAPPPPSTGPPLLA